MKPQTWPADRWPTAEEWLDWLLSNDRDDQLQIAQRAIDRAQEASRCLEQAHEIRLREALAQRWRP